MASKQHKDVKLDPNDKPSPAEGAAILNICFELRDYLCTPEGLEVGKKIAETMEHLKTQKEVKPTELTEKEIKAFKYIKEQLLLKKQPIVRDVAWAAGLKSSRSGARLINVLVNKGYLAWSYKQGRVHVRY